MENKYKTALVIGRFQPLHKGHLYLFRRALKEAVRIIIGVGSIYKEDESNPFGFEEVKKMLEKMFKEEDWRDRVVEIAGIPDFHDDDDKWQSFILENIPEFDAAISNNNWVTDILEETGCDILNVPYYKRELYEGVKIRNLMRKNDDKWKERVPEYLVNFLGMRGIGA